MVAGCDSDPGVESTLCGFRVEAAAEVSESVADVTMRTARLRRATGTSTLWG